MSLSDPRLLLRLNLIGIRLELRSEDYDNLKHRLDPILSQNDWVAHSAVLRKHCWSVMLARDLHDGGVKLTFVPWVLVWLDVPIFRSCSSDLS